MQVTVEISLYPLRDDYEDQIFSFISAIKKRSSVKVFTTAMSTYIQGEWDEVTEILKQELYNSFKQNSECSVIMKIIPRALPIEDGFLDF